MVQDETAPLIIENVKAVRAKEIVFNHINLTLHGGEIHAIMANSFLELFSFASLISGNYKIASGCIYINGAQLKNFHIMRIGRQIDFLMQENSLFGHYTVIENLFFESMPSFPNNKVIQKHKEYYKAIQEFNVALKPDKKAADLTKDEVVLTQLLRLYFSQKKIAIIFDPLNMVSREYFDKVEQIIKAMQRQKKAIIILSTKLENAFGISEKLSLLKDGVLFKSYDTRKVYEAPDEFIHLLSGCDKGLEDKQPQSVDGLEILKTIIRHHEMMNAGHALMDKIDFFAEDIAKILDAKSCIIYLYDTRYGNVVDSAFNKNICWLKDRLKVEIVKEMIAREEGICGYGYKDDSFAKMFMDCDTEVKSIVIAPIITGAPIKALIQVAYDTYHWNSEREEMYLSTFSKEIIMTIEMSQLMGNSVLLQETHHRIKNNLQIIISILYMYCDRMKDKAYSEEEMLNVTIMRIKSIAVIHNLLAHDKFNGGIIRLKKIIEEVSKFYESEKVSIILDTVDIGLPYNKATSISIVVNELVSNCIKHAFIDWPVDPKISIQCATDAQEIHICISDNGRGLEGVLNLDGLNSVGLSVVKEIVSSLDGKLNFENKPEGGLLVRVSVPIEGIIGT